MLPAPPADGYINMATREWKDGLLSCTLRELANVPDDAPKWIVLDGDLGAQAGVCWAVRAWRERQQGSWYSSLLSCGPLPLAHRLSLFPALPADANWIESMNSLMVSSGKNVHQ